MRAKLGEICTFQSGGTPPKNDLSYYGGSIPWITTVSLNGGYIDTENAVEMITEKAIIETSAKIVPANSILVGTRVGIGKVAINTTPMSTSQDIIALVNIDDTKWDKDYLCKLILGNNHHLCSQARGATIKGIKIDTLANIIIPQINIEEQKQIASILNRITALIALRKKQLEKLDELVKSREVARHAQREEVAA